VLGVDLGVNRICLPDRQAPIPQIKLIFTDFLPVSTNPNLRHQPYLRQPAGQTHFKSWEFGLIVIAA
jgi:hypothetical protein